MDVLGYWSLAHQTSRQKGRDSFASVGVLRIAAEDGMSHKLGRLHQTKLPRHAPEQTSTIDGLEFWALMFVSHDLKCGWRWTHHE